MSDCVWSERERPFVAALVYTIKEAPAKLEVFEFNVSK
jgi:hypothetical protein